ncbi:MAG: ATP-dependent helicase, partial [Deltaproteobacteria bacterium]
MGDIKWNYPEAVVEEILKLDEDQQAGVDLLVGGGDGAVVGNPGSGKTRTLVTGLAVSVCEGRDPKKILAMTFTNEAADEMRQRLSGLVGDVKIGTIHSVCLEILRNHWNPRLMKGLTIETNAEKIAWEALREARKRHKIRFDSGALMKVIEAVKREGVGWVAKDRFGLNQVLEVDLISVLSEYGSDLGMRPDALADIYRTYEKLRDQKGVLTFDDMLLWAWQALVGDAKVRQSVRSQWECVIVDEAQDSNPVQWDIARIIRGRPSCLVGGPEDRAVMTFVGKDRDRIVPDTRDEGQLVVYGDPSQSIYGFRGAKPQEFVSYATEEGVELVRLGRNYRSGSLVCKTATGIVGGRPWHLGGEIQGQRNFEGEVEVRTFATPADE